ncbi:MAG: OmpA family protein [Magnetovibrionaceae bacterium]
MMMLRNLGLLAGLVFALAACELPRTDMNWDFDAVRELPNQGGAFDQALQADYADLAVIERDENDWVDAGEFLERARAAAAGQRPEPDKLENRELPPEHVQALTDARAKLMGLFARGARTLAPQDSARAQTRFDCWMQEQEENIVPLQQPDIDLCRNTFFAAVERIEETLGADLIALLPDLDGGVGALVVIPQDGSAGVELDQPNQATRVAEGAAEAAFELDERDISEIWGTALNAQPIPPKTFLLYFQTGGTDLTTDSLNSIADIAADIEGRPVYQVVVIGHTDSVGRAPLNARLSLARAEAVRDLLIARGFEADALTARGFGESAPLIDRGNNAAEPQNRRVEVTVR